MPRATRKAIAEDAPSRSSPRASTRASTVAASSPSPTKTRGSRGKAEEPDTSAAVETKARGRSSSRAKAVTPPPPAPARQVRGRSSSAAKAKTTPAPAKRGRGKPKKQEEEEEEEEEEEVEEEEEDAEEEEEEEEVTPKRGRGQKKTKTSPAAKKATPPPARGSRSSRRSADKASKGEEEAEEEPKKTTPRRGRGKASPAPAPQSRGRRGRGAGEPQEEEEEEEAEETAEETAEDGKTDESGEAKKEEEADSEMKEESSTSKQKAEEEVPKAKEPEDAVKQAGDTTVAEKKAGPVVPAKEKKEASSNVEMKAAEEKKTEAEMETKVEEKQEPETKTKAAGEKKAASGADVSAEEKSEPVSAGDKAEAAEKVEAQPTEKQQDKSEEAASVEEPMEEDDSTPVVPQPPADAKNGDMDDGQLLRKPAVKRKLEEEDEEETLEESQPKRARVNGTENTVAEVEMKEPAAAEEEDVNKLLKEYEVVSKEELPAPDSAEVAAAVPPPAQEKQLAQAGGEEKMKEGGSGEPVMVVPLTEAEMAKAYASEVQGLDRGETDDVSSTIVEVGSVAGSDVTGGLSRGLDVSELQSASNSVDGDDVGDSSMNESLAAPEASSDFVAPAPLQETKAKVSDSSSAATNSSVPESTRNDSTVPDVTQTVTNGAKVNSVVDQPSTGVSQNDTAKQQTSVQNSHSDPPLAKGSGSVTDILGSPDPAFLAKYSSPGILNRAFVPNPAVPNDSVAPQDRFSVVCYNILAECHRRKSTYKNTPDEFLGQEYRHNRLMQELKYLDGDIVCLQEVDPDYFNTILLPAMRSLGYDGLIKRRTQEYFHEGEATFYKCSVFDLESSKAVSLTEVAHKEVEIAGLASDVASAIYKYLDRADVVLITRLRCKATGKVVTVGNIHVVWDMKSPDVQCIQAACAVKEVVGTSGSEGAHIVCGDFNAEWSSPVYQLVLDGYLSDSSIHALQSIQRLELNDGAKSLVNHLWRAFQHTSSNMKSAYSTVTKSEAEVTCYPSNQKTVDYTFYSASSLVPVGVLKTVDAPVVNATPGLPTKHFPSDHLALKTVMAFCK
ncbi:hypothetical protein ACOMHN_014390 [Nucella lapillus]